MGENIGSNLKTNSLRVAVVYPFFAHYRGPVIESLDRSNGICYTFISGDKTNSAFSSLKLYDFNKNQNSVHVKNTWLFKHFLWQSKLRAILKDNQFDSVIFLGDWKYLSTWLAVSYLKKNRVPVFYWGHGITRRQGSLNNIIKRKFLEWFDGGFVYSEQAKALMESCGFKNKSIDVVYNSLNYELQQEILSQRKAGQVVVPKPYVIFSGRLVKSRNLSLLFQAIKYLRDERGETVSVVIIGDGPYANTLKTEAQTLGIEELVCFFGACYDEMVIAQYFVQAIACVFPGPIGLTAIHALTYGAPVITNDDFKTHKPEVEAIVNEKNGFFFKREDARDLAEKIFHILGMSQSQRNSLKEYAKMIIEKHYTPANQARVINRRIVQRVIK